LELGFHVAVYGWSLFEPGAKILEHIRLWNSLTSATYNNKTLELFHNNPNTSAIIASIAFGMGMNLQNIFHSINLGIPDSCDALIQQNGWAGRDLATNACGWTYIELAIIAAIGEGLPKLGETGVEADVCLDSELILSVKKGKVKVKVKHAKEKKPTPSPKSHPISKKDVTGSVVGGKVIEENLTCMIHTHPTLLDLLPPPSDHGNLSLLHYVIPILPNTSSLIKIAFHQTTLLAWVTILLHQFQNFNLSEPILTTCRVVSILPILGALTICSHPPYQLPGHMRTPQLLYSASHRSLGSVTATFASRSTTTPK
jgi:hypothetical protein